MVKEATLQVWLVSFERCKSDAKPSEYLTKIGVVAQLARRLFDMPPETAWDGLCRLGCCWVAGGWLARSPRYATNSMLVLSFTRFEAICGVPDGCPGLLQIQRLRCFLKASRRHQGTTMHAKGCYKLNVCIVFYTLRGDMRVPGWIPRDATNSMFALCFTGIEAT